jgi:hypothetical protein
MQEIWILRTEGRNWEPVMSAHGSEADALEALRGHVRDSWAAHYSSDTPMPEDIDEAVEEYFDACGGRWEIDSCVLPDELASHPVTPMAPAVSSEILSMLKDATSRLEEFIADRCECDNTHEQNGTTCCLCQYRDAIKRAEDTRDPPGIERVWVVSTSHITKDDGDQLTLLSKRTSGLSVRPFEYGWYVPVRQGEGFNRQLEQARIDTLSSAFLRLLKKCQELDIQLLQLDSDGEVIDGLPTLDW